MSLVVLSRATLPRSGRGAESVTTRRDLFRERDRPHQTSKGADDGSGGERFSYANRPSVRPVADDHRDSEQLANLVAGSPSRDVDDDSHLE